MSRRLALILTALMLLAVQGSVVLQPVENGVEHASWNYIGGANVSSLEPVNGGSVDFPHLPGSRPVNASVQVAIQPSRTWENSTMQMSSMAGQGIWNDTRLGGNGLELGMGSSGGWAPTPGMTNRTILNETNMSGNHSFNVLHLGCGIIPPCGRINAVGDLTIHAERVIIDVNAAISATAIISGGQGSGGNEQQGNGGTSPGAGGAGHAAAGGTGGSFTSTNNSGSSHGNGSESGSSGGNVSNNQGAVVSNGGLGGGFIRIYARYIDINGTIEAEGGDGDNAPNPAGGSGPGVGGGGGGSGGSILLQAWGINIGNTGQVKADGGDGGDGSNGMCTTICVGLYDGGHGGGGGSGGYIWIRNSSNGLSNSGVVSASAGSGGLGGSPYGTGTAGNSGSNGGSGLTSFSRLQGSTSYVLSGEWTSPIMYTNDTLLENATANLTHHTPSGTTIEFWYRTTLDNTTWTDWIQGDSNGTDGPRCVAFQFRIEMTSSNNTTTPWVSDIVLSSSSWDFLEDFRVDLGSNEVFSATAQLGGSTNATFNGSHLRLFVPVEASPVSDGFIFIDAYTSSQQADIEIDIGSTNLLSEQYSSFPEAGSDIQIPLADLLASWPMTATSSLDGIGWANLVLDVSGADTLNFDHVSLPWSLSIDVDLVDAMDEDAINRCGNWYNATANCLPAFTLATSGNSSNPNLEVLLQDLDIDWLDDIPPGFKDGWFEVSGSHVSETRHGKTVDVWVQDWHSESNILVEAWAVENPIAADLTSVVTLGSSTTQGAGASTSDKAYVPLLEDWLQENNSALNILNLGAGGARVDYHTQRLPQILAANPQVVTFLPFSDYAGTSVEQWWSDYVPLLEDIHDSGAWILFFDLRIDPQYVCGNGSGPGGCYGVSEAHSINQKNDAMRAISANFSNMTLVPYMDSNAAHPEWNAADGHPNDVGHSMIAEGFISAFRQLLIEDRAPHTPSMGITLDHSSNLHHGSFETSDWNASEDHHRVLSVRLTDQNGNSAFHGSIASLDVKPQKPSVLDLGIMSSNGPLDSNARDSRWWHNETIHFGIQVRDDRSEFTVSLSLTDPSGAELLLPAIWNATNSFYEAQWTPGRDEIGSYDIEVLCNDTARGEVDADGLQTGIDGRIQIVDLQKPVLTMVSGSWHGVDTWRISTTWDAEQGESVSGSVSVTNEDGSHYRTLILVVDSTSSGYVDLDTSVMEPGTYYAEVSISDDQGNPSDSFKLGPDIDLVISPPTPAPTFTIDSHSWDGWNLTWSGGYSNQSGQPVQFTLEMDYSEIEYPVELDDGEWSLVLDMRTWLIGNHGLTMTLCDDEQRCTTQTDLFNTTEKLGLSIDVACDEGSQSFNCTVSNDGAWSTTIRIRLEAPAPDVECSEPLVLELTETSTFVACSLDSEASGNRTLQYLVEAMDIRGEWIPILDESRILKGLQKEETDPPLDVEEEEDDGGDDTGADSSTNEKVSSSADGSMTTIWLGGAVFLVVLAIFVLLRNKGEEEEEEEEIHLWGMEDHSAIPQPMNQDIAEAVVAEDEWTPAPVGNTKPQWVKDWQSLPGGGEYSSTAEGQWYCDGEGDWWWSEPDGSWSRRN